MGREEICFGQFCSRWELALPLLTRKCHGTGMEGPCIRIHGSDEPEDDVDLHLTRPYETQPSTCLCRKIWCSYCTGCTSSSEPATGGWCEISTQVFSKHSGTVCTSWGFAERHDECPYRIAWGVLMSEGFHWVISALHLDVGRKTIARDREMGRIPRIRHCPGAAIPPGNEWAE